MSVRPVFANGSPERVEPAVLLLMFNSYAAGVKEQPEVVAVRSRRRMRIAKPVEPLRQVDPMGSGNPGCRDVSLRYLLDGIDGHQSRVVAVSHLLSDADVAQSMTALDGFGFRLGRREQNPPTPQPGRERSAAKRSIPSAWERRRSTSATWRVPSSRRDQLRAAGLAGNEGLKHPVTPARALLAESYVKSAAAALPSWAMPCGRDPGNGEGCPQISRAGNLEKPDNTDIVAPANCPGYPLRAPPANC